MASTRIEDRVEAETRLIKRELNGIHMALVELKEMGQKSQEKTLKVE